MKNCLNITFLFFSIVLFLNSCKEDIDLVGEFEETAIVYGLLDQSDSTHFIKINRAFIGPGNALEIAKIPDSSYFSSVNATIYECIGNDTTKSWILKDTVLKNKSENGVFYAPTEKVYYFKDAKNDSLNTSATYKLKITLYKDTDKEFTVEGETKLVTGITSGQSNPNASFDFINSSDNTLKSNNVSITNTGNASIINASLKLNFNEYENNTLLNTVNVDWNTGESEVEQNSTFSTTIQGKMFYELIRDNATKNPSINKRKLSSITIVLTGGSEEFKNYINSNKPSSSLAQTKPIYTNLKITHSNPNRKNNVVGIFSSRLTVTKVKYFAVPLQNSSCLTQKSREYLCTGSITSGLFFCSNNNFDGNKTYYCP